MMGMPKLKEITVLFEFKNWSFLVFKVIKFGSHIVADKLIACNYASISF